MDNLGEIIGLLPWLSTGLSAVALGAVFIYFPKTKSYRAARVSILENAARWRIAAKNESAERVERLLQRAETRLPVYGWAFVFLGTALVVFATSFPSSY